jgi:hypothetical protein
MLPVLGKAHDEVNFGTIPLIYSFGDAMINRAVTSINDWNFVQLYFVLAQKGGEGG